MIQTLRNAHSHLLTWAESLRTNRGVMETAGHRREREKEGGDREKKRGKKDDREKEGRRKGRVKLIRDPYPRKDTSLYRNELT